MAVEKIIDPLKYLNFFSMHDVEIENIIINFEKKTLELKVFDLNWNYEDSPDYMKRSCSIMFIGIKKHYIDILDISGIRIESNKAKKFADLFQVDFDLNEGGGDLSWGKGRSSISITFESMKIIDEIKKI
jgi:hypothetical protein